MAGPTTWGGVARRGAGQVGVESASSAWRTAVRPGEGEGPDAAPAWEPEQWIDEGALRDEASGAVDRGRRAPARAADEHDRPSASGDGRSPWDELRAAAPPQRVERLEHRLREAGDAYRRERYEDARRILRPLAEQVPTAAAVRELYGLTLYRLGRWAAARKELEAFAMLTGSTEQHHVLADCNRALRRYAAVDELWLELRQASPSAELVAEGRIVAAGALADQGRIEDAIRLLEAGSKPVKRARHHHLRMAYALADLYERAGDLPHARELFTRVAASDPDFVDVDSRLRALR